MTTPEYATYDGLRVQVMSRFTDREECHYCGNAPLDEARTCPACGGSGYESKRIPFARIGILEGPDKGRIKVVKASGLMPVTEETS